MHVAPPTGNVHFAPNRGDKGKLFFTGIDYNQARHRHGI